MTESTESKEDWIEEGPDWNPDVPPIRYMGTAIRWHRQLYDSVVIPLIVATKHVFWDLRIAEFRVSDHIFELRITLPSVHGPNQEIVSFQASDVQPSSLAAELSRLLNVVGKEVLSESWRYRIVFQQGSRSEVFEAELERGD